MSVYFKVFIEIMVLNKMLLLISLCSGISPLLKLSGRHSNLGYGI
jgi:hypothetical protein